MIIVIPFWKVDNINVRVEKFKQFMLIVINNFTLYRINTKLWTKIDFNNNHW